MRLAFSECSPDYDRYLSPYQVWAYLESGETPATAMAAGFLPVPDLSHYYLARSVRIDLQRHLTCRKERQVQRKNLHIKAEVIDAEKFHLDPTLESVIDKYFASRYSPESEYNKYRFRRWLRAPLTTSIVVFIDTRNGQEIGIASLYVERVVMYSGVVAYDPAYLRSSIGRYMLETALDIFQRQGQRYAYLGSCYSSNALYKTRHEGAEVFTGHAWSSNPTEVGFLVEHQGHCRTHLLECEDYLARFPSAAPGGLGMLSLLAVQTSETTKDL